MKYDWLRHNGYKRQEEAKKKFKQDLKHLMMLIIRFRGRRNHQGFVRISSKFLKKRYPNYHILVRHLEEEGKIKVLRQFVIGEKAYGYKVTLPPEEEAKLIKWYYKYNDPKGDRHGYLKDLDAPKMKDVLKVIDANTSEDVVRKATKRVYVSDGKIMAGDREYKKDYYVVTYMGSGKKYFYGPDKMKRVIEQNKTWMYKGKVFCGDKFIEDKSEQLRSSWLRHATSMKEGEFYYKTSLRNRRTFDNITCMPNKLTKLYVYKGESLDLIDGVSYQATLAKQLPILIQTLPILSTYLTLITSLPPIVRGAFCKAVDSGFFYEKIMDDLASQGMSVSRKEAKKIFFTAIFSKDFNNEWAKLLASFDPEMKRHIDAFKEAFGYNHYAIALQIGESGIWSRVKKRLEELGIYHVGKHDAVLVPQSRSDEAMQVVIDVHNEYLDTFHISRERIEDDGTITEVVYNQDYQIRKAA